MLPPMRWGAALRLAERFPRGRQTTGHTGILVSSARICSLRQGERYRSYLKIAGLKGGGRVILLVPSWQGSIRTVLLPKSFPNLSLYTGNIQYDFREYEIRIVYIR